MMYREILLQKAIKIMNGVAKNIKAELIRGVNIDTRNLRPGELFFALKGENTDGHKYTMEAIKKGAIGVVVQQRTGVPNEIMVNDTLFALGELARYYRNNYSLPIIGITGTNGKTTVKNLLAGILATKNRVLWTKKSYNSLIGLPLMLFKVSGEEDYVILEMGTSNPGEIKRLCEIARPNVGIITNVGPGHLKGLGSIEGVRKEKSALIESLPTNGMGFVGPGVGEIKKSNVQHFSFDAIKDIKITESGTSFVYNNIEFFTPLLGLNNVYNCVIALQVTAKLGIEPENQIKGLKAVKSEPGRMEPIKINGLIIINDAYNANPASMRSAIDFISHLKRKKVLILGDMLELGEASENYHREIGAYAKAHSDIMLTWGTLAKSYGGIYFADQDKLVDYLFKILKGDEVILVKASRALRLEMIIKKILKRV